MVEPLSTIGSATERGLAYLGGLAQLLGRAFVHVFTSPLKRSQSLQRANHQAMMIGVTAVPVISFITFFIGVIMALQGAYELKRFGALHLVADTVAISITRELGPLVTAIVVIGRSGSAFAAEIGTMKVTEELDAIETMALHPIGFLVTPKLLAMLVIMPCLTIWADLMGVLGGSVFGVIGADYTFGTYLSATRDSLYMRDIITGLIKSIVFALVITGVGCQEGFATGAGSEEVGRSTTAAVVTSIFLVVLVDLVFTAIFYVTSGA
jgi:phospholipid/cholesterol/gamma-HCH transport system permease protein